MWFAWMDCMTLLHVHACKREKMQTSLASHSTSPPGVTEGLPRHYSSAVTCSGRAQCSRRSGRCMTQITIIMQFK